MSKYKNVVKGNSTQKKIKVVAYCDSPTCATGFATVSRNILDGLHDTGRFTIDVFGINYWGDPHNFPYRIWPAGTNSDKDPYGRKKAFSMIQQMDFDILFFLQDTFILEFLPELHNSLRAKGKKFRSICYFPIDGTPKVPWIHNVNACDHLIAYSDFGKRESMGVLPIMKEPMVIPHGVNTKEYFPVDKKEVEAFRSHFFGAQANKFIFTNVNRNQQRKDIPRTIVAFSEFHKQAPDSILYLHCFSEGTEIRVFNGIKNIEDITKGDVVLTKNGVFKEVYETSCRELKEEESIMEVCVTGRNNSILATSDHRFMAIKPMTTLCAHDECLPMCKNRWIYRKENWISNCDRSISENYIPEWVETKDLKEGDYLLIPIPKNNIGKVPDDLYISDVFNLASINYIEDGIFIKTSSHPRTISIPNKLNITKELMKLFGYYLSEGCVRGTMDTVQFTFNIKEVKYVDFVVSNIKNIFGLTTIVRHFPEKNTTQLTVCSSTLAKFFKSLFGHSAHTKKYPEWFNFLSDDKFFGLITGMFDGDGHYTDRFIAYSSVSLDLITLVRDGLLRRKFFMSIRDTYRPDGSSFNGFMATIHSDLERLYLNLEIDDFKLTKVNKEYYHFFIDGYVACRIHSIKPSDYTGSVYNMSVVDDESYCVNGGFIAHNCAKKDQGWDLPEIVKSYGLSTVNDVIFPENFGPNQGYPRNIVNLIYNASDCVISTTLGEGFGFCLHPETNIYTDSGIKCIKDLTVMDKVLSSNGTYNEVQAIMSKYHDDSLYNITTWMSNIPIKSSPEHGFLTLDNGNYTWKKAENLLVGDQLLFPRNCDKNYDLNIDILSKIKNNLSIRQLSNIEESSKGFRIQSNFKTEEHFIPKNITISSDLMKMFGLYLAEGSVSNKMDSIMFSFHKKETHLVDFVSEQMKNIFGLLPVMMNTDHRGEEYHGQTIIFYSSIIANLFVSLFGSGARNKKIDKIILNQSPENLVQFIHGEFIGDGSYSNSTYELSFSTTSKHVAYGLRLILSKLGLISSVRTSRVEYKVNLSGISKEKLLILFDIDTPKLDRTRSYESAKINDDYLILPIKKIKVEKYCGKLIDIQVANTNDFIAENVVVHNSWIESMATKTPVIMPGNTMMPEFITEDRGWLVKSGSNPSLFTVVPNDNEIVRPLVDVEDMIRIMKEVYSNSEEVKKRTENAYSWATTQMDWSSHIVPKWLTIFDSAYKSLMAGEVVKSETNNVIETESF